MIKLIIGGTGSGKSVTLAKFAVHRKNDIFVNFALATPNSIRLKHTDIIAEKVVGMKKNGQPIMQKSVNYPFWKERLGKGCDILLDEAHNIFSARMSMSKQNVLLGQWLAQIRKILGTSEKHDIILASQRFSGLDVVGRDLCHHIIACHKIKTGRVLPTKVRHRGKVILKNVDEVIIINRHFVGEYCVDAYLAWLETRQKSYKYSTWFVANPYFKYYDSYELIDFGNEAYL